MNALYANTSLLDVAPKIQAIFDAAAGDTVALQENTFMMFMDEGKVAQYAFLNFDKASADLVYQEIMRLVPTFSLTVDQFKSAFDFNFGLLGNGF